MNITQLAGSLPRNPRFREWVECEPWPGTNTAFCPIGEDLAAQFIRERCGVTSRRDLDTNREAAQRFHNLIRKPYLAWCEQMEQTA